MCVQVLAKLICESIGIQILEIGNFHTCFSNFWPQFEGFPFNISVPKSQTGRYMSVDYLKGIVAGVNSFGHRA